MTQTKKIINEGSESIVALVANDKGSHVIKTRRPHGKTQYQFEAYAYQAVKKLGSRVPDVISVTDTELIMSALSGETLDDKVELYNTATLFDSIARDLAINRKITFEGYGKAVLKDATYVGKHDTWPAYLETTYTQLVDSTLFSDEQKKRLQIQWQALRPVASLAKGVLVHGDFALSSILVSRGDYEGIIDYGDAFIGDPLMDLAYFRYKEITKEYGYDIYNLLADSYAKYTGIDRKTLNIAVSFYMLYWGIVRTHADNLDKKIIDKFTKKTLAALDVAERIV